MEIFPVGFVIFTAFLALRFRSSQAGFNAAMATIPFGSLAVITLGNFNLLIFHISFAVLLGLSYAAHLISPKRHLIPKLELTGLLLIILAIYAIGTSQIMPRMFEGDVRVFSLDGAAIGQRVSPYFSTQVSMLRPSSGNISQPVYFLLSTLIFLMALRLGRTHGAEFLNKGVTWAACVNATVGLIDLVGGDALLLLFKTAGYSIFGDVLVGSLSRMTGAFPEASAMGAFSATLFAYMFMRYLDTGSRIALGLAGANFAWGALALSSTGFVALGAAGFFIVIQAGFSNISNRIARTEGIRILIFTLIALSFAFIALIFTQLGDAIWVFVERLIVQKGTSLSALERGAWARRGIELGFETYGWGAGLGSTRSNGLFAVLFSNLGVIGLILYTMFLYKVVKARKSDFTSPLNRGYYNAAVVGLFTSLTANLVSGTTADPGLLFMVFAAIAVVSRPPKFFLRRRKRQSRIVTPDTS